MHLPSIAVIVRLSACGEDGLDGARELRSLQPRDELPDVDERHVRELAAGNRRFGYELYAEIATGSDDNVVLSSCSS